MATPTRDMLIRPTSFEVTSESKAGVTYRVQLPDCDCPDFKYRRTHKPEDPFCKHLKAAFVMAGWQDGAITDLARRIAGFLASEIR